MKKLNLQFLFIVLGMIILFSNNSYSQSRPIASSGIFVTNNTVEVRVRVDSAINTWGYISNVMFTIKCPDNAQTTFLGTSNINFISNPYGFGSPNVTTNGGFKYLTFIATPGMGGTLTWPANTDYQLVSFYISGGAGTTNFDISNDSLPDNPWYFEVAGDDYTNNATPFYQQTVLNVPLGLYANFSVPSSICVGSLTTFTNLSFDVTAGTTYEFDFDGAGGTYGYNGPNTNFNSVNSVTYASTVPTEVYLRIIDGARQDTQAKTIVINPVPTTPTAGNNGPVCVGANIVLTASTVTNATYNWTGPNSFTSNLQNPVAITSTAGMVGIAQVYDVTATVNGCTSAQGSTSVTVLNAAPTVDAGSNITICQGIATNMSGSISGGGTGVWTIYNGPSGVVISDLLTTTTSPTSAIEATAPVGTYDLVLTGSISLGCTASDQMTLEIKTQPVIPTFTATPSTVCQGFDFTLAITNIVSGATYTWTTPDAAILSGSTVTRTSATASMVGDYYPDIDLNGCTYSAVTTPVTVTVEALPTADAGANLVLCQGETGPLNGTATGFLNEWTLVSGPIAATINSLLSDVTDPASNIEPLAPIGSYTILLTTTSFNGCIAIDQATIEIKTQPAVPTITATPSIVCIGSSFTLNVTNVVTGGTYTWYTPDFVSLSGSTITRTNANAGMDGNYTVKVDLNGCVANSAPTTVVVDAAPTVDAGANLSVCQGTNGPLTGSASGSTNAWTLISGPSGAVITDLVTDFTNPASPIDSFAPVGTYDILLTTTTASGCSATDQVTVVIKTQPAIPTFTATPSTVCEGSNFTLAITNIVSGATYTWTTPDLVTLSGSTVTRTNVDISMDGNYYADIDLNGCSSSAIAAPVTVTVEAAPTADAGANLVLCHGATGPLTGSATGTTNTWTLINGPALAIITDLVTDITDPASAIEINAPVGTYTIQLTSTSVNNCFATDQVTVVIKSQPVTPTFTIVPSTVCEGSDATFTVTNVISGASYNWNAPDLATLTGSTVVRTSITPVMDGSYSVDVDLNGCTAGSTSNTLTVDPLPTVDAGANISVCFGSTPSMSGSSSAASNAWTIVTGPSGVVISDLLSTTTSPTSAILATAPVGTYTLQLTGTTASNCIASDIVNLEIKTQPAIPTFSATPSTVCEGSNFTLAITNIVSGATYTWTTPDLVTLSGSTVTRTNVDVSMDGDYYADIDLNGCSASAVASPVTVTVEAAPTADAGANLVLCQGATGPLTGSASGTTNTWTLINGPALAIITDLVTDITDPASAIEATAPIGTYTLQLTSTSVNNCFATDQVTITINTQPAVPTFAASPNPVCETEDLTLNITNFVSGATYTWTTPDAASLSGSSITRTNVSPAMDGDYTVIVNLNGCIDTSTITTVTVNPKPVVTAGASQLVCQNSTANLFGSLSPFGTTGIWTLVSGPGATTINDIINVADQNDPSAPLITSATSGTYVLQLKGMLATCSDSDQVIITIISSAPAPIATSNSPVCVGSTLNLFITNTVSGYIYSWTGPSSFQATGSSVSLTNVTAANAGDYIVNATYGTCSTVNDTTTVIINPLPTVDAGTNFVTCQGTAINVGGSGSGATFAWTLINGPGSAAISDILNDPTDAASAILATAPVGTYTILLTTTASNCSASDQVTIEIKTQPVSPTFSATPSAACEGGNLELTITNVLSGATYSWVTPDLVSLTGATVTRTNLTSAMAGAYSVDVDYNGCTASSGTTTVAIDALPTVDAGANVSTCRGTTPALTGSSTGTTNLWILISGPSLATIADLLNDVTDPNSTILATAPAGSYTIQLTASTVSNCTASDQVSVVILPQPATPTFTALPSTVCIGNDLTLTITNNVSGATYTWVTPDAATISGSSYIRTSVTSAMGGIYAVDVDLNGCTSSSSTTTITVEALPTVNAGSNLSACQGATPALTGSSTTATNAWTLISGPSGSSSITDLVNDVTDPVSTILALAPVGTYTIQLTGTSTNNCMASDQVTVTILPQPNTPTFTALPSTVCIGNDLTLTITNNVSGANYTWVTPDAATINGSSYTRTAVTSAMGGIYAVDVDLNGCTSSSSTTTITVEALPTVNAGSNLSACQGATPALTGSSTGTTNVWTLISGPSGSSSITDLVNDVTDPVSTILALAPVGTYTIQLTGTSVNNCMASDQVSVEILTQPATPTFTTNSPICETDALTLSVTNILSGATYTWNTPDAASVSGSYVTRVPATLAMDGNYSVDVDLNGCTANSGNTAVSVSPKPVVSAGSNITTCVGSTSNLSGALSPSPGTTGVWTLTSGPGATTINDIISPADQTDPLAPILPTAPIGTYVLQLTGTLGSCTASDQTVIVIQTISPTPIATSNSPVCVGSTLSLSITNIVTGYIYQWSGPSFNATGSTVTILNATTANAGDYIVTGTYGTCTSYPDTTTVVVNTLPTVDAGVVMSECQGSTANVGGSGTGTSYQWTLISGPGTSTISDLLFDPTDPVSVINATVPVGSYTIQLTATNMNGCTISDQTTVEINTQPAVPTFTAASNPVCAGTDIVLSVINVVSGATYTWTTPDAAPLSGSSITRTNVSSAMDGDYTVIVNLNGCVDTSTITTVVVNPKPVVIAGASQLVCQNNTANLFGSLSPFGTTGIWTLISGPGATTINDIINVADQNDPSAPLITSATPGTYVLQLKGMLATCSDSDQVTITIISPAPAPIATSNSPVCVGSTLNLSVTNTVSGYVYSWTGPSSFQATGSSVSLTNITAANAGDYIVNATYGTCSTVNDTTTVVVNTLPTVDAGTNFVTCQGTAINVGGSGSGATFTWTLINGPGSAAISDILNDPTDAASAILATAPVGTYTILLTTTASNCSASDQVTIEIKTQPVSPTFTSNSPVCEGGTIELVITNLVSGASYSWTTPDLVTLSGSTITRTNATSAMDGTYSVDIDLNGCTATGSVSVTINPLPIVDAGNNITVCQNTAASLNGSVSGSGSGNWTLSSGPSGSTVFDLIAPADQTNLSASLLTSTAPAGNYILMLTGTLSGCSATDLVTIVINSTPAVPTGSSNSPVCEGSTIQLNVISPVSGETYQWSGPNSFNTTGSTVTKTNSVSADAGNYTVIASNGICNSPVSANVAVTVNPLPTVDAGNNINTCQGTSVSLSGSITAGATAQWSLVSGPSGTNIQSIIALADLSNPTASLLTSTAPSGTYILQLTAVLSGCSATDQATVIIIPAPAQPVGSSNSPVCEGSSIILSVNSPVSGLVYEWSGPSSFASTGTTVTRTNAISAYAGNYTVTASDGLCNSIPSSSIAVTINPLPVIDAGNNINTCQGATTNLTGSVSSGSAQWTLISGPTGATISSIIAVANQTSPTAALLTSTAPSGTYILQLTGTLTGCTASDQVTVLLIPTPAQPVASSNSPVCEGSSIILSATSPISGLTYQWTGPSGYNATGTTATRTNATSAFAGNYTLTASNGMCTSIPSANVAVTINPLPIVDAGSNVIVCQGTAASLSGSVSGGGSALWTLVSGPSGTTINNIIALADQTTTTAPLATTTAPAPAGIYVLQLTGTLTGCSASDQVTVVINATPAIPTANSNSPVCEGSTITLNVNTPINGLAYQWNGPTGFNATGTTVNRTNASSAFAGNYTVAASDGTCISAPSANVAVTINPLPVVDAGSNITACQGATASVTGSISAGSALWTLISGPAGTTINTILTNPASTTSTIKTIPLPAPGNYILLLTGTLTGCSASDQMTVTINALPAVPTASSNSPVCSMQDIELSVVSPINGLVYEWNGPNGYHATGSTAVINNSTLTDAGSYTVIASNGTCFSVPSAATVVVVNPTPEKTVASNNGPICEYDTLYLYASTIAGVTYNWTGPNGFTSALQNPSIINALMINAGVYYVTTTLGSCISEPTSTLVIIKPTPDPITSITGGPVCEGDQLIITALPAVPGATYHWTVPSGTIVTTSTNVYTIEAATLADKGNYTVTLSFDNGCMSKSFTAAIIVNPIPLAPIVSNQITHCIGDTIFFYADQIVGAVYHWSGPNGFTSGLQNPTPFIATIPAVGVYSCYVTVNGCNSAESKTLITIDPLPPTPVLVNNSPLCYGGTFTISVSNPLNGGIYRWIHPDPNNPDGNIFLTSVPQLVLTNIDMQDSGLFKVTVTGSRCTSLPASINLEVNPLPDPTITANGPIEFCDGNNVTLSGPSLPGYSYLWSNGAITQSIVVSKDGLIKLTVTNASGCKKNDSIYITVWKRPIAFAGNDTTISKGFSAHLQGKGTPATLHGAFIISYLWSPPQTLDNPAKPDPIATPFVTTLYNLIVTDEHSCGDTDDVVVTVIDNYLVLPDNVITPNGDGKNDTWWIENILTYPDNHVMIYNRYGNKVYDKKGYANEWDGGGLSNGTYYYVIKFDGSSRIYKGTISIIDKR